VGSFDPFGSDKAFAPKPMECWPLYHLIAQKHLKLYSGSLTRLPVQAISFYNGLIARYAFAQRQLWRFISAIVITTGVILRYLPCV